MELSNKLQMSFESVQAIFTVGLSTRRMATKHVLKLLLKDNPQHTDRTKSSKNVLKITSDEYTDLPGPKQVKFEIK